MPVIPATYKLPRGVHTADVYFQTHPVGPLRGFETVVTSEDVDRWNRIYDDDHPWFHGGSPWGGAIAPPSILYYANQNLMGREFHSGGGFARYTVEFLEPIPVGRTLTITGEVEAKFVRRGRGYYRWRMDAHYGDTLVQRSWKNWSFRLTPEEAAGWPEVPSEDRPNAGGPALETLGPLPLLMKVERLAEFEGPGEVNSHTDQSMAEKAGFPAPLAQGAISFGLLTRLMRDRFGAGFIQGGALDARFVRPTWAGQTVRALGEIIDITDGVAQCQVRVENPDGEILTVGTATARVEHTERGHEG